MDVSDRVLGASGVILWELLTKDDVISAWQAASGGNPTGHGANIPFWANNGLRPAVPVSYQGCVAWVTLIEDCWQTDAAVRPTMDTALGRCALLEREELLLPVPEPEPEPTPTPVVPEPVPELEPAEFTPAAEPEPVHAPPAPAPLGIGLSESITEVESWLATLGLERCAQNAAESADYCDVEDFEGLDLDEASFAACLEELGIEAGGKDAAKLRAGVAALQ